MAKRLGSNEKESELEMAQEALRCDLLIQRKGEKSL